MQNIRPPKMPKKIVRPFSLPDIDNLLVLCSGTRFVEIRNRAIILVFLDTGLRLAELAGIQMVDINFHSETIKVMGKGAKERVVRIGKTAQKSLLRYLLNRHDDYPCLWVTEERKPMTAYGIQTAIKNLCRRAEIKDAKRGPHSFRHTFGTQSLLNGADIREVQSLLGHSTLKTTLTYVATVKSEEAIKRHRVFSPVDRMFHK
ncbi:Tyrosine recombinase XerD [subsurface metagenome]